MEQYFLVYSVIVETPTEMGGDNVVALSVFSLYLVQTTLSACPDIGIVAKASNEKTWPSGFRLSGNVTLDFPLLLDVETPRLSGVHIVSGGRLVFSPQSPLAKLVTDYVKIGSGGSLDIGSEDCPFSGTAEVLLTGKRGSYSSVDGEKFISVHMDGSLEIHGQPKPSWTKLTKTVSPGGNVHTLYVLHDVTSWVAGDQLVLASTDYDLNQAEVVTVQECLAM